jgi:AraC-like DNA-binding protein
MNEGTETRLAREGPVARLVDGPRSPHERWPRAKAEFVLGGYVILGRRWTESDWSPCEVRFQHVAPIRTEPYQSLFRSRVSFGQARNEILFDAALLAKPLKHADPDVAAYLCRQAEIQSLAIRPATSLLDLVRRCVERELPNGAPTVTAVSRQLEVKRRTLQRRLAALGTSFSALVDEARREVALRCALKPGATENQLAFRTGLSEDRAFRRAFRRWTGLSFAEWRAREMAPRVRSHGARGPSR